MKSRGILITLLMVSAFAIPHAASAQTSGQFTLTLSTTSTGGYSPKHVMAIWLENSTPSFVKTKLLQCSGSNLDHLGTWTARTGSNTVDATTGATIQTHGIVTVVWNGTAVDGSVVPDGTYNVWVEMAWASSLTTGKTYTVFTFTKGPATFHSNPANLTNFYNISLDWIPGGTTSIEKVKSPNEVVVYPNPSKGMTNVHFKNRSGSTDVRVFNEQGTLVLSKRIESIQGNDSNLDLSSLAEGLYFISFQLDNREEIVRFIKTR
ncbi:MAG: DUF2271 domain-containing protein [Bacteroidales bacterium]